MIAHSIDQFILDPKPLLLTRSYWIPSQIKTKSNLQIYEFCQNFKFLNIEKKFTRDTPALKLLNEVCKYEMDPSSLVEDTERTWFCPQTDRGTRWNRYTTPSTSLKKSSQITHTCHIKVKWTDGFTRDPTKIYWAWSWIYTRIYTRQRTQTPAVA